MHPPDVVALYDNCTFDALPHDQEDPYALYTSGLTAGCLNDRECWKGYYAAVTAMDRAIGQVLAELDTLGLAEETLVVFASDHGFSLTHHGTVGKGNSRYPLNLWDTNLKVPLIFRQPGRVPAGVVRREPVTAVDFGPTVLQLAAGLAFDERTNVAGASYARLVVPDAGDAASWVPATDASPPMAVGASPGLRAAGSPDDGIGFFEYGGTRGTRYAGHKYVERHEGFDELFDLTADPTEVQNLVPSAWGTGMPPYPGSLGGKNNISARLPPVASAAERLRRSRAASAAADPAAPTPSAVREEMRQTLRQFFAFFVDPSVTGWSRAVTGRGQLHMVSYAAQANLTSRDGGDAAVQWALGILQPGWSKQDMEESGPAAQRRDEATLRAADADARLADALRSGSGVSAARRAAVAARAEWATRFDF